MTALEQHLRPRNLQGWKVLVDCVDAYFKTMQSTDDLDVSYVRRDARRRGICVCGKTGRDKCKCRDANFECRTSGKTRHLSAVCRHAKKRNDNKRNAKNNLSKTGSRSSGQGSSNDHMISVPNVARKATRSLSAESKTAQMVKGVNGQDTFSLCANLLGKFNKMRVETIRGKHRKTKQMLKKSG